MEYHNTSSRILQHQQMHFPTNPLNPKFSSSLLNLKPYKSNLLFSSISQPLIKTPTKPTSSIPKPTIETLKLNWLSSLSCSHINTTTNDCNNNNNNELDVDSNDNGGGSHCVIGVDPDLSGALALLKPDLSGFSAQVFDSPYVQVPVGKTRRRRLDARSIVQLVQSIEAPRGTIAYLEQSIPYPQDGKQGWWSGGFGYGLWIGILVASGYSVVPVPSSVWKKEFQLVGSRSCKDDSRELAAKLFPNLSPMLKRKKDHGRAEALLIAAYGKGLNPRSDESCESKTPVGL